MSDARVSLCRRSNAGRVDGAWWRTSLSVGVRRLVFEMRDLVIGFEEKGNR